MSEKGSLKGSILILDFGSQYTQLIARRVREQHVTVRFTPSTFPRSRFVKWTRTDHPFRRACEHLRPRGLAGDPSLLEGIDLCWEICYGRHWIAEASGGLVARGETRESGGAGSTRKNREGLGRVGWSGRSDQGLDEPWRQDRKLPQGFEVLAEQSPVAHSIALARRSSGSSFTPRWTTPPMARDLAELLCVRLRSVLDDDSLSMTRSNLRDTVGTRRKLSARSAVASTRRSRPSWQKRSEIGYLHLCR